jgi:diketogulonate reductase-like aldo/keto reductase
MSIQELELNNGLKMPAIGFGTWDLQEGDEAETATREAIKCGYRLIDTAKLYGNEKSVGKAVRESGVDRSEIFVTTKLWKTDQGFDSTLKAFDESLKKLGLDYIDLYLIHSPSEGKEKALESWKAMEKIYEEGRVKAIGISNFNPKQTQDILENCQIAPAVNQILFNPFVYSDWKDTLEFCHKNNIVFESYSPLAQAADMKNAVISEVAAKHNKSNAQIMLRWAIQHSTVSIPKSANPERMRENLDIFDFELSGTEMHELNDLSQ